MGRFISVKIVEVKAEVVGLADVVGAYDIALQVCVISFSVLAPDARVLEL